MPETTAVLLYGPPASGKDTITEALTRRDERYQHFHRLKAGDGRRAGYRMITTDQLDELVAMPDEVLWRNSRYGATYVIDRTHLSQMLSSEHVPVIHLGQLASVSALTQALSDIRVLIVSLTCPRAVAQARISARKTGDTAARLHAYDETADLPGADLTIDTSVISADQAAALIDTALQ